MKNILIILTQLVLLSCINTLKGSGGACNDIEESRKKKVFVNEYKLLTKPNKYNDTLGIKSIWLEKSWKYGSNLKIAYTPSFLNGHYQLIMRTDEKIVLLMDYRNFGINNNKQYLRTAGKDYLMCNFDFLPSDTLQWNIIDANNKVVDSFSMVKINNPKAP